MANYAREKSKYGGIIGSIQVYTTTLPLANDPLDSTWRSQIPAGFLRCDGSILPASEYPELAALLGTGDASKFRKPEKTISLFVYPFFIKRNKIFCIFYYIILASG